MTCMLQVVPQARHLNWTKSARSTLILSLNYSYICRSQDDSLSASELTAQHDSKAKHTAAPTAEALGSVMCLLEACLSNRHMPTPEEAVTEAQNDGESHLRCSRPHGHLPEYCFELAGLIDQMALSP